MLTRFKAVLATLAAACAACAANPLFPVGFHRHTHDESSPPVDGDTPPKPPVATGGGAPTGTDPAPTEPPKTRAVLDRLNLSGQDVVVDGDHLVSVGADGSKLGPVTAVYKDDGGETSGELMGRPLTIAATNAAYFVVVRDAVPNMEDLQPLDTLLVRKADGKVWDLTPLDKYGGRLRAADVRAVRLAGGWRIFYGGEQSAGFLESLSMAVTSDASDAVRITGLVAKSYISSYQPVGDGAVAVDTGENDLWLDDLDAAAPTPTIFRFRDYGFTERYAYAIDKNGDERTLVRVGPRFTDRRPVAGEAKLRDVTWAAAVGKRLVVGAYGENFAVLDAAGESVLAAGRVKGGFFLGLDRFAAGDDQTLLAASEETVCAFVFTAAGDAPVTGCLPEPSGLRGLVKSLSAQGRTVVVETEVPDVTYAERVTFAVDDAAAFKEVARVVVGAGG